jgi:ribonucleoside-diphosphate reductase alpha chain
MRDLYESKSGERGVFSRVAAQKVAARNGRRDAEWDFGTNPCSEIILRPNQFCNLTEVVVRPEDTLDDLKEKVRKAAILGTLQATLTDFRYLRSVWKKNTEEEALLGVSLTGIMDHPVLSGNPDNPPAGQSLEQWLQEMRDVAIETNKEWAGRLGINPSTAITCVKPSGTVSQLVDSASGIHPRFSPFYIRTVRADKKDPLAQYMAEAGFPCETDVTKESNYVFSFPQRAPEGAICTSELGAMDQLRLWKIYQDNWCEHKPSITVYYKDEEFLDVCSWMWKNFDSISGISLLPYSDHTYQQAPYQECTEEEYNELLEKMPKFDWEKAAAFESGEDSTTGSQELACVGNACELPDP